MATNSQISANQANAQHSCGPRTPEGKAISSLNHRIHGFTGRFALLPWESADDFATLLSGLRAQHVPENPTEQAYVDQMAENLWLRQRALALQTNCFNPETQSPDDDKRFALYLRYQTTADRAFDRCVNQLLKLRKEKRNIEIGFESKKREMAQAEAAEAAKKEAEQAKEQAAKQRLEAEKERLACERAIAQAHRNMSAPFPDGKLPSILESTDKEFAEYLAELEEKPEAA